MKRAITGLQPTNFFHIGNVIGAVEPAVRLQDECALTIFVADLHAITVPQKPDELRRNVLGAAAAYLACGIDPARTTIFQQSRVPAHAELAWILQCSARMGELERMTQFKDKAEKAANASVGLFTYPVLMAADILLYDTELVPVGEDQKQHVELARDLAIRFNRDFGETFVVPEPRIRADGARVMGLDDPTKKMSKSAPSPKNYLSLADDADTLRKKIMSAVTDSGTEIRTDRNRPAITNLLTLFSVVSGRAVETLELSYAGKGYGEFKRDLAEAVVAYLAPIQTKLAEFSKDPSELRRILDAGAKRANENAEKTVRRARRAVGLA